MNVYLVAILGILIGGYGLTLLVACLNVSHIQTKLPDEFADCLDAADYARAQTYLRENTRFGLVQATVTTPLTIGFIVLGGFNAIDQWARAWACGSIATGLIFTGVVGLAAALVHIPFAAYETFVIEEKYGFNRTTIRTFVTDRLKGWVVATLIGAPALALIFYFFERTGPVAWLYAWGAVTALQLCLAFVAPAVIMPLFNTFTPLAEGDLSREIAAYAREQRFPLRGVYTMDGSKRSTKSNAFFTGFGRLRRIVLFDTLIANHTVDELVSILAHEMGHFRLKHIHKGIAAAIVTTGLTLFLLSRVIGNPSLFEAFRMEELSVYASLVFFGFLYSPISAVLAVGGNWLSRRHEFAADAYAARTYEKPLALIAALKRLSVDNLANLTPHPLKVFLQYSHPPILQRIRAIRQS